MRSELTHRLRKAHKAITEQLEGSDRFVDMGVVIRVVRRAEPGDPKGETLLPGKPRLIVLREHHLGGIIDTTASPPKFVAPSESPVVWYIDEIAEPLVLHGDELPCNLLVEGAMRAGKTSAGAQWLGVRLLEATGSDGEYGVTAPTTPRLAEVKRAIMDTLPRHWWTWRERDQTFTLKNGVTLRLVSTHQASASEGSPVQGFSWLGSLNDELQDSLHVDGDIEARGSEAANGKAKRFAPCTVKDSPTYRTWRKRVLTSGYWGLYRKPGTSNPFVAPEFWSKLRSTLTPQEYARKAEALDLPSESRVYYAFTRESNLRPIPVIGGKNVTTRELERWGRGLRLLLGHDPGRIYDVTTILQAWELPGIVDPVWFIVGEVTTKRSTTQQHVRAVRDRIRELFGVAPADVQVNGDPHTHSGNDDEQPHVTVATVWRQHGFNYSAAAYKPGSTTPTKVPREGRLDMVNTLFCSADGVHRLAIACNDRGDAAAPQLLEALETLETDASGKAERGRKDENDKTHWPASVGYALWPIEQPRLIDRRSA